jgi:lysophospholipase L1-like esterase
VATLTPQRRELLHDRHYERKTEIIPLFNEFLHDIVSRMDMTLVDYHPHFYDDNGQVRDELYTDGVHFSARGYYMMTQLLREAVTRSSS